MDPTFLLILPIIAVYVYIMWKIIKFTNSSRQGKRRVTFIDPLQEHQPLLHPPQPPPLPGAPHPPPLPLGPFPRAALQPGSEPIDYRAPLRWLWRDVIGGIDGFALMRTLVMKELRTMLASSKSYWLLFTLSLIGSGYFIIFWQNHALSITIATRAQYSRQIFSALFQIQFCGLGLISAVMASTTITTERENKTLDLLLATHLTREQVVLGKWFSNIVYQLVLYASLLPILALTFQLGGVGLDDYLAAALLVSGGIVAFGMLGLAISCSLQRTIPALLATVGVAVLIGLFIPAYNFFETAAAVSTLEAIPYLIGLGIVFFVCWRVAWSGLVRRDTTKAAIAPKLIDDAAVLEARRSEWPYYLIDPLARPQQIGDRQNPVYVKEQRVSPLGRLDIIIRLCYAAMFLSFVLVVAYKLDASFATFRAIARWEAGFIMLFVPVLAATGLSKEFEENTLTLLRATPLPPGMIVRAKFRLAMRFLAILCLSLTVVPAAMHLGMWLTGASLSNRASFGEPFAAIVKITPSLIAWAAFYSALSLLCSSLCRRNVTAIVSSYVAMLMLIGSPEILGFLAGLLDSGGLGGQSGLLGRTGAGLTLIRHYISPLLSPSFYFADGAGGAQGHCFIHWESWRQIGFCLAVTLLASAGLLEAAKFFLVRSARRA